MPDEMLKPKFGISTVINHKYLGRGRVVAYDNQHYVIHFKGEMKKVPFSYHEIEAEGATGDGELSQLKQAIYEVLGEHGWIETDLEMGKRWTGGTLKIIPGNEATQSKEIPIEALFKKLIGIREKLRVLEQKINNHPKLEHEEKFELQSYITRCYGSLTTFNVLFAEKESQFKGSSSS